MAIYLGNYEVKYDISPLFRFLLQNPSLLGRYRYQVIPGTWYMYLLLWFSQNYYCNINPEAR